jgi:chromosome segregation ATPase
MRKTIWYSVLAASLAFGGAACKKDNSKITDKPGEEVRKAQENVNDQKEDLRDQAKDVQDEMKDVNKEAKDVDKEARDVQTAEANFASARTAYSTAVAQRLGVLDAKLAQLGGMASAEAKAKAADLKVRRDALNAKLGRMKDQTSAGWSDFTKDIDSSFDGIEHDLYDAIDKYK